MENLLGNINIEQLLAQYILPWGKNIIFAILIYIIGRMIAKMVLSLVMKALNKTKKDPMLLKFIESIFSALLLLIVVIAALSQLGVDTTSLIALIGAAGLAIGLSLQDSLKNFAAGVMILVFKPFRAGDYVNAAGVEGTVKEISVFTMVLHTPDNKEVIVPNGSILAGPIVNFSSQETRRVDMVFGVDYADDLRKAKSIIEKVLADNPKVLKDPAPVVAVAALADSSVNINVRPWVNNADYWAVYSEVHEAIKIAFDAEGITIPFPQQVLHTKADA